MTTERRLQFRPPDVCERILEDLPSAPWTETQRAEVHAFAKELLKPGGPDRIVDRYLQLMRRLGDPYDLGKHLYITEGGRLLVSLDRHVYRGVPVPDIIDPVDWIRKRLGQSRWPQIQRGLDRWIDAIPDRLAAVALQFAAVKTNVSGATKFEQQLLALVIVCKELGVKEIPPAVKAACDAYRQGRTCTVEVPMAGCNAFYWPQSVSDWPELLTGDKAVLFLDSIGHPKCKRSLQDIARNRPEIRRGTKYHRDTLERVARQGLLEHGNRKQK